VCYAVKQDGAHKDGRPLIEAVVRTLAGSAHRGFLAAFLGPDVTLVPVPRSAPQPIRGGGPVLWVPRRICEALVAAGLGAAVVPCVERVTAVQKSATAGRGARPNIAQHIESMRVQLASAGDRITLVDDVVTRGATLFGAASLVAGTFPSADVRAFSLIRTLGLQADVDRVIDPAVGTITRNRWGEAERVP
jgi:predicted amidophosphoribosyltransferase